MAKPVRNHRMVKAMISVITDASIPAPKSNWDIRMIAVFLPYVSEIHPAPNVPTANPPNIAVFTITIKNKNLEYISCGSNKMLMISRLVETYKPCKPCTL